MSKQIRLRLAQIALILSLIPIFVYLFRARPYLIFLALLLVPIALATVLDEFIGGTLLRRSSSAC